MQENVTVHPKFLASDKILCSEQRVCAHKIHLVVLNECDQGAEFCAMQGIVTGYQNFLVATKISCAGTKFCRLANLVLRAGGGLARRQQYQPDCPAHKIFSVHNGVARVQKHPP